MESIGILGGGFNFYHFYPDPWGDDSPTTEVFGVVYGLCLSIWLKMSEIQKPSASTLQETITYPTKQESRKNIDSKVPWLVVDMG